MRVKLPTVGKYDMCIHDVCRAGCLVTFLLQERVSDA